MNGIEFYGEIYKIANTLEYIYIEDLRFAISKFLFIRPLTEKENKVYNKLKDNSKLPFITKIIIKEYLKNGFPKQFIDMFYEYKNDVKQWKKFVKSDYETYQSSTESIDKLKTIVEYEKSERLYVEKKMKSKQLLISIINTVITKLYKERFFNDTETKNQ